MGESSGGRKPTLIELNPNGGFVIGIDLGGTNIKLVLVGLDGKIVKKLKGPTINSSSKNKILDRLRELIHSVIDESDADRDLILGMGIGVSGVTDESGRVSFAPALGWEDMPVRDLLKEEFKIPVSSPSEDITILGGMGVIFTIISLRGSSKISSCLEIPPPKTI
ncbi:unnamed protein product, partial [marine sediment metagenome]